jgi:hypothetical protein
VFLMIRSSPSSDQDSDSDTLDITHVHRRPCRTSVLRGGDWVLEVLSGHPLRCYENFRVAPDVFARIADLVRTQIEENYRSRVSIEERLAMFLYTVGQNASNRVVQERFQHSGETVSRYMCSEIVTFSADHA